MSQSFGRRPTAKPVPAPLPTPVKFSRPGNLSVPTFRTRIAFAG